MCRFASHLSKTCNRLIITSGLIGLPVLFCLVLNIMYSHHFQWTAKTIVLWHSTLLVLKVASIDDDESPLGPPRGTGSKSIKKISETSRWRVAPNAKEGNYLSTGNCNFFNAPS